MDHFSNETASWLEESIGSEVGVELELGVLIAAATDWTEDETEIDDLVGGLIESGSIELQIGLHTDVQTGLGAGPPDGKSRPRN